MNAAIFWNELKAHRKYTIIWTAVLVFSIGANIAGSMTDPEGGRQLDVISAFAQSAVSMAMMSAIFAMILGGMVISREEDEKTIEFLLGHPITRLELAVSKFVAFAVLVGLFSIVLLVADIIFLEVFKSAAGYDRGAFLGIWGSAVILTYLFGGAGLIFSAFITKGGAVVGAGIGVPIITWVLAQLGGLDSALLRLISYVSPYRYLDVAAVISRSGAEPLFVIVFVLISVVFIVATFILYKRRQFAV